MDTQRHKALHDKQRTAKMPKDTIGIDISKDHLDAHRLGSGATERFDYSKEGLIALQKWIGPTMPDLVIYEATGRYHRLLERQLAGKIPLVKVNPLHARRFAQSLGTRAKTDAADARMLARMGQALDLGADRPVRQSDSDLKELQVLRAGLVRDRTALLNRLSDQSLPLSRKLTRARLAQAERQIARLDTEIDRRTKACPRKARALDILVSIPGIGAITARTLLSECPELGAIGSKQIAALAGLAPVTRQSGRWQGKAHIHAGRKQLRDALFMPALVAMKHNPDLARKYLDLRAAGKPHKVALTALMRKLLILANTLIREDRMWQRKGT